MNLKELIEQVKVEFLLAKQLERSLAELEQQQQNQNTQDISMADTALTLPKNKPTVADALFGILTGQTTPIGTVIIERKGDIITIPPNMNYDEAILWIKRKQEAEEQVVEIWEDVHCYPLDGLVALKRAAETIYGFYGLEGSRGFWGMIKETNLVPVVLWEGKTINVAYGIMKIPTWEEGTIESIIPGEMKLVLKAKVKKKFEDEVRRLFSEVHRQVTENSIYKGKAMSVRLDFLTGEGEFHVQNSSPKFMNDVVHAKEQDIILNKVTQFEVATNLYTLIEQTAACQQNKIPLKHGAILAGTFGTGKTLLGRILGGKCVANGWTFIYLERVSQLAAALKFAETYAPACIFAEDADQVTSGDRDEDLNQILNTIDGVDTKNKPIMTVLTTNNPEVIEPAFLRAGRIDSYILLEKPDAESAQKFVKLYAGDSIAPDINLEEVGKELHGMPPAFITESVQKAKRHALWRTGTADIKGKVTAEDLLLAAKAMTKHIALAEQKIGKTPSEQVHEALRIVGAAQTNGDINELMEQVEQIREVLN